MNAENRKCDLKIIIMLGVALDHKLVWLKYSVNIMGLRQGSF